MAQRIVSWFICDGRFRVHAINAVGRRSGRIIEIEDVDSGERVHGTARWLERLLHSLRDSITQHAADIAPPRQNLARHDCMPQNGYFSTRSLSATIVVCWKAILIPGR